MSDKVFFDTNILVYVYDRHEPEIQKKAQYLLQTEIENDNAVLSAQVLGEFFNVVTKRIKSPMKPDEVMDIIDILSINEIVDIDKTLVLEAIIIHEKYHVSYWDALIISAAKRADCKKIYSEDLNNGQNYNGMIMENPFEN